jgi:hypothetical protein
LLTVEETAAENKTPDPLMPVIDRLFTVISVIGEKLPASAQTPKPKFIFAGRFSLDKDGEIRIYSRISLSSQLTKYPARNIPVEDQDAPLATKR